MIVTRRQAAHDRLRDAAYHWARVAAQRDPVSHDKYRSLRARGHGHARALRSVADRLLNVACAMLRWCLLRPAPRRDWRSLSDRRQNGGESFPSGRAPGNASNASLDPACTTAITTKLSLASTP